MAKHTADIAELTRVATPPRWRRGVKLLRFKDWSVQNGVFLLGAFFADNFLARPLDFIAAGLMLSCLCLAYGYALNEFFDDLREKLIDDPDSAVGLHRFIYFLLAGALVLSWSMSNLVFAIVVLIGITVWLHSAPPFRLKRNLFWRLFLNSLGFGLFFLAGAALDNHLSTAELLMGLFIYGLYLPLELIHVLAHMDADDSKGLITFALVHGERKTVALAILILALLVGFVAALWQFNLVTGVLAGWTSVILTLLICALVAFYKSRNATRSYVKLRLQAKILCAVYGMGTLGILIAKI